MLGTHNHRLWNMGVGADGSHRYNLAHEKADRRLLPPPDLADGCDRRALGHSGLAPDRLAVYAVDPELHLDRGAVALSLHLDGHARRDGRHQGRHAFRGRHLARALPARQRDAQDRLEPVRADLRAGVRLLGHQVRGVRLVSGIRARRTTHAVHFRRLAARRRDLGDLPGRDLRRQYPHPGREDRAMTQAAMSPGMAALVLFGSFFFLIALRVPVAFALGLACLPPLLFELRLSPMVLFNETFKSYNSFILTHWPKPAGSPRSRCS